MLVVPRLTHEEQSEKLNVPSPALVAEHGYVVEPSSLGSQGPVDVSFPAYLPMYGLFLNASIHGTEPPCCSQHTKLVQASVELGHKFNRDAYSGKNAGVFYSLSSQTSKAVRETSEFAYGEISKIRFFNLGYSLMIGTS